MTDGRSVMLSLSIIIKNNTYYCTICLNLNLNLNLLGNAKRFQLDSFSLSFADFMLLFIL